MKKPNQFGSIISYRKLRKNSFQTILSLSFRILSIFAKVRVATRMLEPGSRRVNFRSSEFSELPNSQSSSFEQHESLKRQISE